MAGLGIQQSLNNTIETGNNSLLAHELFMSRYKEHYDKINNYNQISRNYYGADAPQESVKKIKSIKDRMNATTNIARQDADIDKKQSEILFNAKQNMINNGNEKYLPPFDKDNPIEVSKLGSKSDAVSKLAIFEKELDLDERIADYNKQINRSLEAQRMMDKLTSDQASAKAESAIQDKLKAKIKARAKRPQVAEESQPLQAQPRKGINIGK